MNRAQSQKSDIYYPFFIAVALFGHLTNRIAKWQIFIIRIIMAVSDGLKNHDLFKSAGRMQPQNPFKNKQMLFSNNIIPLANEHEHFPYSFNQFLTIGLICSKSQRCFCFPNVVMTHAVATFLLPGAFIDHRFRRWILWVSITRLCGTCRDAVFLLGTQNTTVTEIGKSGIMYKVVGSVYEKY